MTDQRTPYYKRSAVFEIPTSVLARLFSVAQEALEKMEGIAPGSTVNIPVGPGVGMLDVLHQLAMSHPEVDVSTWAEREIFRALESTKDVSHENNPYFFSPN